MSELINKLKATLSAAIGTEVEGADPEAVAALKKVADDKAAEKLEEKKKKAGEDLGEQLTAPMVKQTDFDAYVDKSNAFMSAAMDHIEKTQLVLDGLEEDINNRVSIAMDALLAKVTSKTQVPAANQFSNNGQNDQPETEEEYNARRQKIAAERENNRKLTT